MVYKVLVDDNYHSMDESERYELGVYPTLEVAVTAAKKVVDEWLRSAYKPGITADELLKGYKSYGEDPFIEATPPNDDTGILFSAWDYARLRCEELCAQNPDSDKPK